MLSGMFWMPVPGGRSLWLGCADPRLWFVFRYLDGLFE